VLDSEYFRKGLQADVDAMGGKAVVELHLANGRSHRLRSVVSIQQGYVTLEAYGNQAGDATAAGWYEADREGQPPQTTERMVAPYEAISSVSITSVRSGAAAVGFGVAAKRASL
jgi:hypothetical protein